jgi:hypothetical protein
VVPSEKEMPNHGRKNQHEGLPLTRVRSTVAFEVVHFTPLARMSLEADPILKLTPWKLKLSPVRDVLGMSVTYQ